ncbi:MAG: ABC transporter C-terminal domain-containing protein, partial [Sphingopyxis sp.]
VKPNSVKAKAATAAPPPAPTARKKLSYKDQRDFDMLPGRIDEIEKEMAGIEIDLSDGSLFTRDNARFNALTAKLDTLREEKAAAEDRWLELAEEVEALG